MANPTATTHRGQPQHKDGKGATKAQIDKEIAEFEARVLPAREVGYGCASGGTAKSTTRKV
jgi:hypothetical protein